MPINNMFLSGAMSGNNVWDTQQLSAPTKQQKFPGLTDEQIKRLESITSDPQRQQELYKQTIQQLNQNNVKENRIAAENEMTYRNLNQKDTRQRNYTDSRVRLEQLADLAKDKYGLRQDADTQSVINGVIGMAQDQGISLDEMNNYLDTGDQNFLYNLGLKENPKEKLRENYWDNVWDNITTQANVPIDTLKKRGKKTFNEASEKIYKKILKNTVGDILPGEMGINLDDYIDTVTDKTVQLALRQDTMNYQNKINERQALRQQKNLDQDIANYYNEKGYTKLLREGDFAGFLYKSLGDAAQNWEMPVVIAASVFQPEVGLALMATDSYARENQEAFEGMTNNGATYEQAQQGAVVVGLINSAVEVTLDRLLGGLETTASTEIRKIFTKNVQEEAIKKGLGRILLEGAETQLKSSAEEGLEEVVQQIVQNAAVKTVNENQDLFEGVSSAFEGGFYNPMNLLAGGGNINQNIQANKSEIRQSIMDSATTAATQSRELLDAISDKTQNTVDNAKNKVSGLVDQTYGIDETLKKNIQDNPYSAQIWNKTKKYIEENGRPEKAKEVSSALIDDVVERVEKTLSDKLEDGSDTGRLYKPLLDAGYSVDLSDLKSGIDDYLTDTFGIEIKDGELDFSKTAIDGSEASNIRKIYNWIKETNTPMALEEYKNRFRPSMQDMVDFNQAAGRDQAGRKLADTQGDKVIKGIMAKANELAHNQIPELAAVDKKYSEWVAIMDEVSDGLVYRDKTKRGAIRDNITQIISNLDNKNRRQLANRLEKIMPGITEEVRAINMMPQLINHVYKPSRLQQTLTSSAGGIVGATIGGGILGGIIGAGGGYFLSNWIDKLKSSKWDKIISETSEDGKAKLNDIQARIENNEKISQEQKAFLEEMSNKLKESKAAKEGEIAKIIAEVASADNNNIIPILTNAIAKLDSLDAKAEAKEMRDQLSEIQDKTNAEVANYENLDVGANPAELTNADVGANPTDLTATEGIDAFIKDNYGGNDRNTEEVTTTPKKKTTKKKTSKKQTENKVKLDTKKIASDYMKGEMDWNKYQHLAGLTEEQALEKRGKFETAIDEEWDKNQDYYNTHQSELVEKFHHLLDTSKKGLDKNQASSKTATVENTTVDTEDGEVVSETEIETLPADVSIEKEAKQVGEKRIAPDRVPRQQLTFDEGVKKLQDQVKTVADYIQLKTDYYNDMYGEYKGDKDSGQIMVDYSKAKKDIQNILWKDWQFKSNKSKEFVELRNNIKDNIGNEKGLEEIGKTFYISKVKKDISKGYQFPIAVLEKIPGVQKALNARERYQKGLDTSFSAKDARIDYSEKDKIGGGIKSQDGKQVTKEQKDNIVKGILDFQDVFGIDVKKIAEDKNIVFVDLHGGNAFLSQAAGLYREATNKEGGDKNVSVSVGGSETIRWKDKQTNEWKTEKVNTTMSHELGHAMDYLVDKKLLDKSDYLDLYQKYKKSGRRGGFADYLKRPTEVTARAFEEYMDVAKGGDTYYDEIGYRNKEDFEYIVKPILEEAIEKKLGDWKLKK